MRVSAPRFAVQPDRVVVTAVFESYQLGEGNAEVRFTADRALMGRLDLSATPFVPLATLMATALAEDVAFTAPVDPSTLSGGTEISAALAKRWADSGWSAAMMDAPPAATWPAEDRRGHGVVFDLDVGGWARLLSLREESVQPVTHLLTIEASSPRGGQGLAGAKARRRLADHIGLPLLELGTNAYEVLDPVVPTNRIGGAVEAASALLLSPLLAEVTIGDHIDGTPPDQARSILAKGWSSSSTSISHIGATTFVDKVSTVAEDQMALDSLLVCSQSGDTNCGACVECLITMTALDLFGALDHASAFPPSYSIDAIRRLPDPASTAAPAIVELVDLLPLGVLRLAWESHLRPSIGTRRLATAGPLPMAGPDMETRVNLALSGSGWRAVVRDATTDIANDDRTHEDQAHPRQSILTMGWGPGQVPLRPAIGTHRGIRATMADHAQRPFGWVIAEPADPDRVNDPWPAKVADQAERAWGPGICYLSGIGWDTTDGPVLNTAAVSRLLRAARVRIWWGPSDALDALRVVESIEHGCLPLQVVPAESLSVALRGLPRPMAPLVTDLQGLAEIDLDPNRTEQTLAAVAAIVMAGSADRDLALHVAFDPVVGHG